MTRGTRYLSNRATRCCGGKARGSLTSAPLNNALFVITAAAIRCLNGYMVGRLVGYTPEQGERMKDMGISDPKRIYTADDLAPGKNIIFSATGVTDGPLLKGVRFFGDGVRTSSLVMKLNKSKVRFIETVHGDKRADAKVRIPER